MDLSNIDEKINVKDLNDPESNYVKFFLYIYTIEPFIYFELNKALVNCDESKIK